MTVDQTVHLIAGLMVLASVALTHFVDPNWIWLAVFVGANLAQSGLTRFCPLASMLRKAGMPEGSQC